MRSKPFSKLALTLWYLHEIEHQNTATALQIYHAQKPAKAYLDETQKLHKLRDQIIRRQGFTKRAWLDVLEQSRHFWFGPDHAMKRCNKAVQEIFNRYPHINEPSYSWGIFSGNLHARVARGTIQVIKGKPFQYWLDKDSVHAINQSLLKA